MIIKKSDSPVGQGNGTVTKHIGVFEGRVLAINPDQAGIAKLLGLEEENVKEPDYISEDDEGNTRVQLVFWVEDVVTGTKFQYRILLTDKKAESKDGNPMWVNCTGDYSYQSKDQMPDFFKHFLDKDKQIIGDKAIRQGYVGEEKLYTFIKSWLTNGTNFFDPETDLFVDMKKLFRGNFKELTDLLKSEFVATVLFCATIRTNNEGKTFQSLWRDVLPGYWFRNWTGQLTGKKAVDRWLDQITDPEYGCKDIYTTGPLQVYTETN